MMLQVQEPLIVQADTHKALKRLRTRVLLLMPLMVVLFFVLGSLASGGAGGAFPILRWIFLLELPVLYALMSRRLRAQNKPIVTVSSQGLSVSTVCTQVGFMPWHEIKDVYTYSLGYRFVGVTLNNPGVLYQRLGLWRSLLVRSNALVAPLYRIFGIRVALINIPQEYLPMSADALAEQIQAYRSAYA